MTITATSSDARIGARIGLHLIAVITGFITLLAFRSVRTAHTVPTGRRKAIVGATVRFKGIPIIALLANLLVPITTPGPKARRGARIRVHRIAVITGFVLLQDPIATALKDRVFGTTACKESNKTKG